jgi:hypothetical protein
MLYSVVFSYAMTFVFAKLEFFEQIFANANAGEKCNHAQTK